MIDLASATAVSIAAVLVLTELAKLVPVEFTSKYPAWVNGILSFVAALIVVKPNFNLQDIGLLLGQLLFVAVVAALAYNQWTSKLKGGSDTTYQR